MAPSAVRSFAITLAIAIAVGRQSNGFTINRSNSTPSTTQATEFSSDENFQLQVKDDLKKPDHTKLNTDGESNKNTSDILSPEVTKQSPVTTTRKPSLAHTTKGVKSTTEDTRIPTISSDTVEVFDSVEEVDFTNSQKTKNSTETSVKRGENKDTATKDSSEPKNSTVADQIAVKSEIKSVTTLEKSSASSITNEMPKTKSKLEITTESVKTLTKNIAENINGTDAPSSTTEFSQTTSENPFLSTISTEDSSITTESSHSSSTLSDSDITQTTTEIFNANITEPMWDKYTKYTTITRKKYNSFEDTSQTANLDNDSMTAETSNTQMNIQTATVIPPLQKKRIDLLSVENHPKLNEEMAFEVTGKTTVSTESTKTTEPKRKQTVEAKRGGFLDNTERASSPFTSAVKNEKGTVMYEAVDDNEAMDTESPDFRKARVTDSESQRQLAEDARQEELLKEESINNNNDNANRYRDEQKNEEDKVLQSGPGAPPPVESEDSLNVQPISHERSKTTLYTPSPSYKPMKKIDVQPAKPFVRDPDDNSWRNESISSLGIVFKPKVSSKSFKEVLKNKTQTELNNLQEKEKKDDVPDLRVRLEKIAEVRKTKKKMNKDGEVVYSDYEEGNSAETSSTLKPDMTSSLLSSAEIARLLTSFNFPTDLELTTPTSNNLDTTKTITKTPFPVRSHLTTQKPKKKLFNIAEYYDTTDEYDADYFTMSNIDLKRFTQPPKTTQPLVTYPIGPLMTRPTQPYFDDRKPTVQYFPPRQPLKVNVDNLDPDFERKVNLFTFKDNKPEPRPKFVTVPSFPIATEKPESEMRPDRPGIRPTVKPTDLLMYTPGELSKSYYLTNAPRVTEPQSFVSDGSLNRGSYVIKHYKDFLDAAAKDDDDRHTGFLPLHTPTEPSRATFSAVEPEKSTPKYNDEETDYDTHFRKELLTRFVDNFNQNSERFKVDFPILYNSSIVHRKGDGSGRPQAASRAYVKRVYEGTATETPIVKKPCEPRCDVTVELSPAYELHYYVPGQEEREEPRSLPLGE